jgi:hypothetical protein
MLYDMRGFYKTFKDYSTEGILSKGIPWVLWKTIRHLAEERNLSKETHGENRRRFCEGFDSYQRVILAHSL